MKLLQNIYSWMRHTFLLCFMVSLDYMVHIELGEIVNGLINIQMYIQTYTQQ